MPANIEKRTYRGMALGLLLAAAFAAPSVECFTPRKFSVARGTNYVSPIVLSVKGEIADVAAAVSTSEAHLSSQAVAMDDGLNNIIGTNGVAPNQPNERYKAISLQAVDKLAERHPQLTEHLEDIKLSGLIFPFKASPYFVDELIDWEREDLRNDPFYRLVFPTMDMLIPEHQEKLIAAKEEGDPANLIKVVGEIRGDLNPHPAGQKTLNAPKDDTLTGVQHKYSETCLVFPAAAQTCHAYCTYCFRWAQFIGDDELRFAQKEAQDLFNYLEKHEEISDILMTGGDPMIMRTNSLAQYLEPFTDPDFLPHIKNLRIGTRSLTFWPQRFTTDKDADDLIVLLRRVREDGKRHLAIMAHLGHDHELSTDKFKEAVNRIQKEAFATIRSQSPIMRGINDDSDVWARKWRKGFHSWESTSCLRCPVPS
jgi:L-lysine 2,3-aminomutase